MIRIVRYFVLGSTLVLAIGCTDAKPYAPASVEPKEIHNVATVYADMTAGITPTPRIPPPPTVTPIPRITHSNSSAAVAARRAGATATPTKGELIKGCDERTIGDVIFGMFKKRDKPQADIVRDSSSSVVRVETTKSLDENGLMLLAMEESKARLREGLTRRGGRVPPGLAARDVPQFRYGSGSGLIVNGAWDHRSSKGPVGVVATAYHVVEGAITIIVKRDDSESTDDIVAKILATDKKLDLALLIIPPLADGFTLCSPTVKSGDQVLAMGYPLGLEGDVSVTQGVVSRQIDNSYIQHDAAILQGNSGGPLLDSDGHVIGVNVSVIVDAETVAGLNIAVDVRELINLMIKTGMSP